MADDEPLEAETPEKPFGRPSIYSDAIVNEICDALACGESILDIVERDGMPAQTTIYRWLDEKRDFREKYTRAREWQAEHNADEIVRIADKCEDANKARLQIDARKWRASKQAPKKYGDKVTQEVVGPNGGPITHLQIDPKKLNKAQLENLATIHIPADNG